jgi:hypothetical protein
MLLLAIALVVITLSVMGSLIFSVADKGEDNEL